MTKIDILEQLRLAKLSHIGWVQRAKLLIAGIKIEEEAIPINCTDCKFGQWFYSDAQKLTNMSNNPIECMKTIEALHFKLHDEYLNIFKVYYNVDKKGFFSKLFHLDSKKKPTELEEELAKNHYKNIELISKDLLAEISKMERRIMVISDDVLDNLY